MKRAKPAPVVLALVITQKDLLDFQTDEAAIEADERKLKERKAALKQRAHQFLAQLETGARCEDGALVASKNVPMGKCSPAWKEEYLDHMEKVHGKDRKATEAAIQKKYPAEEKAPELVITSRTPAEV